MKAGTCVSRWYYPQTGSKVDNRRLGFAGLCPVKLFANIPGNMVPIVPVLHIFWRGKPVKPVKPGKLEFLWFANLFGFFLICKSIVVAFFSLGFSAAWPGVVSSVPCPDARAESNWARVLPTCSRTWIGKQGVKGVNSVAVVWQVVKHIMYMHINYIIYVYVYTVCIYIYTYTHRYTQIYTDIHTQIYTYDTCKCRGRERKEHQASKHDFARSVLKSLSHSCSCFRRRREQVCSLPRLWSLTKEQVSLRR